MNEELLHGLAQAELEALEGADFLMEDDFLPPLDHQARHGAKLFGDD